MPLELHIAERLHVPAAGCPPELFGKLRAWAEERYVLDNPAYWQAREHRRPCAHLPRTLALATWDDEGVTLPRGANRELKKWLAENAPEVPITVVDHRAAPVAGGMALRVELRPYQQEAVDRVAVQREGVVVAPTGSGKTVIAMGIVARLGLRALIVVHTRTLMDQTCAVVERTLGVPCGRLGGGQDEVRDVTVATVQTLVRRDPEQWKDLFGLVILDEAHHCPASTFTEVLQRFPARYRVGLTATPERADRLHPLMYATLGPELLRIKPAQMVRQGSLCTARVTPVATSFHGGRLVDRTKMISKLCEDVRRNDEVVATVVATRGRRALVLSERVEHCETLVERLRGHGLGAWLLVGKLDAGARQAALEGFLQSDSGILVATTSLVGEGFDCPELDTLYLVVPSGNATRVTQALGRVLRPQVGKSARVYDFVDAATPALARSFRSRIAVYKRHDAVVDAPLAVADLIAGRGRA